MNKHRVDLYGECNVSHVPVEQFKAQCCDHCMNPECTRSQVGKSLFETRTATWQERLFTQVPRMVPDDARYGAIAGQKFLLVNPALKVSSDWKEVPAAKPQLSVEAAPAVGPAAEPAADPPAVIATAEPSLIVPPTPAPDQVPARSLHQINTPALRGQMLSPAPGIEQVVQPGARIKLP